jgi:hypothetical protein
LLIERWHPVTSDMGLIQAPASACVASFTAWQGSIGRTHTVRTVESSLADAFELLPPLSMEARRQLFAPTLSPEWTAFFESGIAGSDPTPVMSVLAARLGTLAMRVCVSPSSAPEPAVIWEVFAPSHLGGEPPLGYRRSIAAVKDGRRWVFEQFGAPFPFERVEHYAMPRKRDRFTADLLMQYLSHFGLAPHSDSFYSLTATNPATVLERVQRWATVPPEFSLSQVVAGLPWRRAQ